VATKDKEKKKKDKEGKRWRDKGEERLIRREHVSYKVQGKEKQVKERDEEIKVKE
jgi:hypothetical protein